MMRKYSLLMLCIALAFGACREEDEIGPIQGEKDWFVLEDSDDPIDKQRFAIYEEFDIPVYYNDTIGSEVRYAVSGEPYMYYERLQVFYNPGGQAVNGRFVLLEDKNAVKPVLDYLQQELLPAVPRSFYIPSILLVDSLVVNGDSTAYKGFNTVVCAKVKEFSAMDEEQQKWWRGGVMAAMLSGGLLNDEAEWLEEEFFGKSLAVDPENDKVYSGSARIMVYKALENVGLAPEDQALGALGFLNFKWKPAYAGQQERMAYVPTREEDVRYFCEAIFALGEDEFAERWGEYPVVMEKYEALKGKLQEYGFEIN